MVKRGIRTLLNESEGASFWLQVLTDLNNRGLKIFLLLLLMV